VTTLRIASALSVVAGALGSIGLLLRAGQRTPRLLLLLFTIWVLSPFVGLLWANAISQRWAVGTRATLYGVGPVVALGSVAVYGGFLAVKPPGSANGFLWVAVPPVTWAFMTIAGAMAAIAARRSR
jgi:hypothetical protein